MAAALEKEPGYNSSAPLIIILLKKLAKLVEHEGSPIQIYLNKNNKEEKQNNK